MNIIFVLVLITYGGGVHTQEFSTQTACEAAKVAVLEAYRSDIDWSAGPLSVVCVEK